MTGEVLASLEVASSRRPAAVGCSGRDGIEGALLLSRPRSVHTLGMRFPIDVAFLDADLVVLKVVTMRPWRVGRARCRRPLGASRPRPARSVVGASVGDVLEIRSGRTTVAGV